MKRELQAEILRACARFIKKTAEPIEARVKFLESIRPVDAESIASVVLKQMPAPAPLDVEAVIAEVLKRLPKPKDGENGTSVTLADVDPILEAKFATWALGIERHAHGLFQKAISDIPVPKDGKDGIDGLGWDDLIVEFDGKRTASVKVVRGQVEKVCGGIKMPVVLDAGFWQDGTTYEKGDGVTFGGSYWIAQEDTDTKPEVSNKAWRLAVRKGRDGKRD